MLNRILNYTLIPCVLFNTNININNKKSEIELNSLIVNDIKNINSLIDNDYYTRIHFIQKTLKQIKVLGWVTNWKKWENVSTKDFNNTINLDLDNKLVTFNLFPEEFEYTYFDPDPFWCDPHGAKWNNKTHNIKINYKKSHKEKLQTKNTWYGTEYNASLNIRTSDEIDDNINLAYPPHNYFTHSILMYINGTYRIEGISKNLVIKKINNDNIIKSFIQINKPYISNNYLVWNEESIAKCNDIFSFNDNMKIIKTLSYANEIIDWLEQFIANNTINGLWNNKTFNLFEIEEYIDQINNLKFRDYQDLFNLKNSIMNNRKYKLIGNYNTNLLNLNINLIKNNLINDQQQINLNNVNDFYQTLILYFKNIDIIANLSINGQYFNIPIWTNNHFYNFLNDVKITNTNLLNISFESITIKDISPENSIITSNDIVIDDKQLLSNFNFSIMYRYNALNIDTNIIDKNFKNSILLNINKYVSELVGTGKNINGYEHNYILNKQELLKYTNNLFNNVNVFDEIIDITLSNKEKIENMFGDSFIFACKKLNANDIFEFKPDNYKGEFYAIMKISNWMFNDGTNGDYTASFKNKFYDIMRKNNCIVELPRDKIIDANGYFLCRFRTNKIIFNQKENRYTLDTIDHNYINQQLNKWFINIANSDNWKIQYCNETNIGFFITRKIQYIKIWNIKHNEIKNIKIKVKIDLSNNASPFKNQKNQFILDIKNSPLFQLGNIDLENIQINTKDGYAYLSDKNQGYLTCEFNLFDLYNNFYNKHIENIYSNIKTFLTEWEHQYNDVISNNYQCREELNIVPTLLVLGSFVILTIIVYALINKNVKKIK